MKTLDELGVEQTTDKSSLWHHYCDIYDELFHLLRDVPVNLLELGVWDGRSVRMWADYFTHPDTRIFGIDLNIVQCQDTPASVHLFCGDQAEIPENWPHPPPVLDIIIDDASHLWHKSRDSIRCWWPYLNPGGCYVIEDIARVPMDYL